MHGRVDRMMVSLPSGVRSGKARAELLEQETCCRIIVVLHAKQPKPLQQIATEIGRTRATVRFWLAMMHEQGIVREVGQVGYVLGPKSRLPDCEIWCFEGKLRNWSRALYQATRYRAFSHRSFVVMPHDCIRPAFANLDRFRRARVGLISVDDCGTLVVHAKPRYHRPRSPIMYTMATGRVLAKLA